LSTALELSEKPTEENWKQLLISDAASYAQRLDAKKLLPFHLPVISRWAVLVLALAAGLGFAPEYRSKNFHQKQKEKEIIKEVGRQISDLTRRNLQQRPPALEPVRESLNSVEQLGEMLSKNPLTRSAALKDLANVTDKIKNDLKELGKNPALQPLERAAWESSRSGGNVPGELQKQIDSLKKDLGNKAAQPDALDKLKKDLEKAQNAAAGMPSKDSPGGAAAREQMAKTLSDLARQAQEMGAQLPSLDEAISALQANQTDLFLKDLNLAVNDLNKLQEMAKTLQQLQQQAASKMGKDLAEQLKNGQAEQAGKTLEKMIEQLKTANLSPEQLKKLLDEVSQAVDPGSQYGKVGDLLKQSVGQMQKKENSGAAKSLAEAADELKKLMEQMGDAQSLMATLENLKKAQMCVGNCTGWGAGTKLGLSNGSKPGKGVGTWADETGWLYYPEVTDKWDNTGMERPDREGKGIADRGDAEISDALVPTKVRGQMTPGGPMPSITLKGVSIKGQSKVGYQEAVTAAQNDAQAAINQDQVPRAYRGTVRDYFDDLKK
ncbi:MAG: hypothetical protein M3Y82_07595, partial [Verrucomicrobiota bacterium]|nr:hypothetical protein [Verrucomicrobiota bacterium]